MNSKIQIVGDEMYFISSRGIKYALLEGKAMLGISTSDIVFIFLNNPDYNCEDYCVGYLFGASLLKDNEQYRNEYLKPLQEIVDKFEKENHLNQIYSDYQRFRYHYYYDIQSYEYLVDIDNEEAMRKYLKQHGIQNDGGYLFADVMRFCVKTNKVHDEIIRKYIAFI